MLAEQFHAAAPLAAKAALRPCRASATAPASASAGVSLPRQAGDLVNGGGISGGSDTDNPAERSAS